MFAFNHINCVLPSVDISLKELNFEQTLEKEDFPSSNGGSVIFQRSRLVNRMVDTFLTKETPNSKFLNFYFRHAAGTGKTVLLKLFGKELQRRGFVVFMMTAPVINDFPSYYFENLMTKFKDKQVALLLDEVQRNVNSKHWDYLLKQAPSNLLVVGTGISDLIQESPQFLDKFPGVDHPSIGQLTEEDMEEVLDYFIPKDKPDSQWEFKSNALSEVLVATGGQTYPFVVIAKHLLDPEQEKHLAYLTSETFYCSKDYAKIRERTIRRTP